jgi:hypothetical protein
MEYDIGVIASIANTFVLLATVGCAILTLKNNSAINRRRATVDLVMQMKESEVLNNANDIINKIVHDPNKEILTYALKTNQSSKETKSINCVLNNYEFIACGLQESAFDLELYKRMRYSVVLRDYKLFKPYIESVRSERDAITIFQDFEWLATEFEKKPLKKNTRR